jgi:hypothetical protein
MIFGVVLGFTVFEETFYPADYVANELLLLLSLHLLKRTFLHLGLHEGHHR